MIINIKYKTKKDLENNVEAIKLARKVAVGKNELEPMSYEQGRKMLDDLCLEKAYKHYVYLEGDNVSDLVIIENINNSKNFSFRKCTHEEWVEYFNKNLKTNYLLN